MEQVVEQVGRSVTTVSAGGDCRSHTRRPNLRRYRTLLPLWDASRRRLQDRFGHPIRLEIEPGRFLVAESGYLIAEIRAIKQMGDNLFYLIDAGFNDLARPILYGAYHPISVAKRNGTRPLSRLMSHGGRDRCRPLCESGDIFTQEEGGFVAKRRCQRRKSGIGSSWRWLAPTDL